MNIPEVNLGKTGIRVPALGFGGIPIQTESHAQAVAVVRSAYEQGVRFFDTARAYSTSEECIGEALEDVRDQVVIATKTIARKPEKILEELATSLKNLRTDYVDLYQLHNVVEEKTLEKILAPGGALELLQQKKASGVIRHIGITSHRLQTAIKAVETGAFETVQFPFNYIEKDALSSLYPAAQKMGMGVIVMKPLAGGVILQTGSSLRWCLKYAPGVLIPGVATIEQLQENIVALELSLSENDLSALESAQKELGPTFCRRCGYCIPCPNGINVNFIVTAELYYRRAGWNRLADEHMKSFRDGLECTECGECESKCPYNLPLVSMVRPTAEKLLEHISQHQLKPLS
ncbi:MAG: aldo/keto reductase [Bacillota bacterium]